MWVGFITCNFSNVNGSRAISGRVTVVPRLLCVLISAALLLHVTYVLVLVPVPQPVGRRISFPGAHSPASPAAPAEGGQ